MLFSIVSAVALHCSAEGAQYQLRHHPEISATLVKVAADENWPAGIALVVRNARLGKVSW